MDSIQTQIESGAALGARLVTAACAKMVAQDNLRTAIGIAAIAVTGLVTAFICRQSLDGASFGALSATATAIHASWSHLYAPALPCPAGRLSSRAIGIWRRYIVDCYFPGICQRFAKVHGVKGSRPGELGLT